MKETDLYPPIRDWLASQGYEVQAEVNHCDVTAVKDGQVVVVEIKQVLGIDLLLQAVERQTITDSVYLAVPGPLDLRRRGRWQKKIKLLRRLELGLICVNLSSKTKKIQIVCHPEPYQRQKRKHKKRALLEEMAGRTGDRNQGGSVRVKLITAYRERAIFIASCLDHSGPMSASQLRVLGAGPKTHSILYNNHYNWFKRLSRGLYDLTDLGRQSYKAFCDLTKNSAEK